MMRWASFLMTTVALVLVVTLLVGCVDDYDMITLEPPGVMEESIRYWVGDVQVEQRSTKIRSYDYVTYEFRGSVKNLGTTTLPGARFEVMTQNEVDRTPDGLPVYGEAHIANTQNMGMLLPQHELPINVSFSYPSFSHRRITGSFVHD